MSFDWLGWFGCGQLGQIRFGEIWFWQGGCGTGSDDAVAASALGLEESVVGELEEEIDAIGSFIEGGDADRDGKSACSVVVGLSAVFPEALADFLGAHGGLAKGTLGEDESEFFATVAAGYVFGAHATHKSFADSG